LIFENNSHDLAKLILKLINMKYENNIQWTKLRKQSRQRIIENFSIKKMITNYNHVFYARN